MRKEVIVTSIHPRMFGFAVVADTGEQAFIAPAIVTNSNARQGETYLASLVPNHNHDQVERTPYQIVRLEPMSASNDADEIIDDTSPNTLINDVLAVVKQSESPMTTLQIAQEMGIPSREMTNYLVTLNNRGLIVKEEIWQKGTQKRPSFVYWGSSVETFTS